MSKRQDLIDDRIQQALITYKRDPTVNIAPLARAYNHEPKIFQLIIMDAQEEAVIQWIDQLDRAKNREFNTGPSSYDSADPPPPNDLRLKTWVIYRHGMTAWQFYIKNTRSQKEISTMMK
ncbi:hypothetical protein ACJ73_03094 [Blastomyces percursus]|uniref:Uncharacterized protein n=1 Tax=Blastomyces percursus TaxID=1658174 RepID=A0A1J9RCZ5_9EURO|nr:hypothetical protein ACJ73_03094 [Blastomyces percursus]